jgi:hypothetical protein
MQIADVPYRWQSAFGILPYDFLVVLFFLTPA